MDRRDSNNSKQELQPRRDSTNFNINVGTLESHPVQFIFQNVIVHHDNLLGFLKYFEALKLAQSCRTMRLIFKRAKVMKRIVRYGNLDNELRPSYWKRISD